MSASKGEKNRDPGLCHPGRHLHVRRSRIDAEVILIPFRKSFRLLCPKEEPAESLNVLHATPRLCAEVAGSYFAELPESNLWWIWWILESAQTLDLEQVVLLSIVPSSQKTEPPEKSGWFRSEWLKTNHLSTITTGVTLAGLEWMSGFASSGRRWLTVSPCVRLKCMDGDLAHDR